MQIKKIAAIVMCQALAAPLACSKSPSNTPAGEEGDDGDSPAKPESDGATGVDPGGSEKAPVRSACGDQPILDDRWKDTTDECKACVDTQCCSQAAACAANADCKSLWECRATCDASLSTCMNECAASFSPPPPQNAAFVACRNTCRPCLDLTTCRQGAWAPVPETTYSIHCTLTSYTGPTVVFPGVTVKVCSRADMECEAPLSEAVTAADGNVTLDIPSAPGYTDAYFEITGPNVQPQLVFPKFFQARALLEAGTLSANGNGALLGLLDTATASALTGAMGATADPTTVGVVSVSARSCGNRNVAGLAIQSSGADTGTIREYLAGVAPLATATATDGSGMGVFADHPPGPATFSIEDPATGETLGSVEAFVRAGFLSIVLVTPSP